MSTPDPGHARRDAGAGVQLAVVGALLLLAAWLTRWQTDPWAMSMPAMSRIGVAVALMVAYAGFVIVLHRYRAHASIADRIVAHEVNTEWLVAYASQTGHADALARRTWQALRDAGVPADLAPLGTLDATALARYRRALFIASTAGEGDAPDATALFARRAMAAPATLTHLQVGVLALGDREYDAFCAFGRRLDAWLQASGARALFDRVDVDNGDPAALRHWQHHVGQLAGRTDLPDWSAPAYTRWTLVERRLLNAGSVGGPVMQVRLQPADAARLDWTAGDIAEIGPRHARDVVTQWLSMHALDGDAPVISDGTSVSLRDVVARSRLTDALPESIDAQSVADALQRLPHREYSIASIPGDGTLDLVVRQVRHDDGTFGVGSGWLTAHAAIGDAIDLRVRVNPSFHPPSDDRPVLLVGNGTGIAGLRALLKARINAGHARNWLVFGERHRAHDALFADELEAWQRDGQLARVDFAFSRDGGDSKARVYVQDVLRREGDAVRAWIDAGASVYVCGSLDGMAPGVDEVLRDIVGRDALEAMAAAGRYRRDVY